MPGLLDSHVHLMLNDAPHISIYEKPWAYVGAQAVAGAEAMLLRGFTAVRDVGGPVAGLKDAIDQGLSISNINGVLARNQLASSRSHTRRWRSSVIDYL